MLLVFAASLLAASIEVDTSTMKSFGHSIKNGDLVANKEILLFSHSCTTPPCTITQMHCPAAGPRWYDAVVRIYVDGTAPPLNFTLLELAMIGDPTNIGSAAGINHSAHPSPTTQAPPGTGDHGPWGQALFGHTASNGGVYSTIRIPFGTSLWATLTAPASGTFWFIIRGVENYPVRARQLCQHAPDPGAIPIRLRSLLTLVGVTLCASGRSRRFNAACKRAPEAASLQGHDNRE